MAPVLMLICQFRVHRASWMRQSFRRCRSRGFQDDTLRWAEQNKDIARKSLAIPPAGKSISPLLISTLERYLEDRAWAGRVGDTEQYSEHSIALISHVLSAPLTLRYCAEQSIATRAALSELDICCIGARAEATLPPEYWKEVLMTGSKRRWNIDFVGPDLGSMKYPVRLQHGDSLLTLQVLSKGYFHDLPQEKEKQWDACLLLNPGLGHPNLKQNWIPTLDKLRGKSLWLTAHSQLDAERDAQLLRNQWGIHVDYRLNPFASRIVYQDPFDESHLVSPNKYVAWIANNG